MLNQSPTLRLHALKANQQPTRRLRVIEGGHQQPGARRQAQYVQATKHGGLTKSIIGLALYAIGVWIVCVLALHALGPSQHVTSIDATKAPLAAYANGAALIDQQIDQMTK